MKTKPLGLLKACLLISVLAWPAPATSLQQPAPQPPAVQPAGQAEAEAAEPTQLLPPVSVEVVRVEVVVTEKRGQPHTGLRQDDFVVLEDGKPQPIVQFQAFARPARGPLHPEPEPQPAGVGEEPAAEDQLPARYVVLAIDDVHMDMANMARAKKALVRFLREDLQAEDQVALVTTSGAQALSQEFTTDRELLEQTLARLSPQSRRAEWMTVPYLTDYQAELIEAGDPLALDTAIQEVLAEGVFQDPDSAEREARRKARAVITEAVYNSRLTLEALDSLCRGLSGVSGRKALFLVSDGFLTGLTLGSSMAFDIRRIVDAGTRAGVVIYSLDTRGLTGGSGVVAAASAQRVQAQTAGLIESMRRRGDLAVTDAMNALAEDTGGFLVENRNDLRVGLREMLKDTETYYLIAYEPTNSKRDGSFRKIDVKLPGLKGLKVRARSGYYAPDDKRLLAENPASGSDAEARRNEQRRAEMQIALGSLAPLNGIPVRLSADYASFDSESTQLVVSGAIDVSSLPFVRRHGRRQATVECVAVVMDDTGEVLKTLETERTSMDLEEADFVRLQREGLSYQKAAPLEPGRYQVRLAVREDATGLLGSAWQSLEIPSLATRRLALSSLFLLKEGPAQGGLQPGGAPAGGLELHNTQAWRHYASGENLYAQIYAYNPKRNASGAVDVVSQAEILKGGVTLGTSAPEPIEPPEPGGLPAPHISRIKLARFEPGEYELRVTVTDRIANAMSARRVSFTID